MAIYYCLSVYCSISYIAIRAAYDMLRSMITPDLPSAHSGWDGVNRSLQDAYSVDEVRHLPIDTISHLPFCLADTYYEQFDSQLAVIALGVRKERDLWVDSPLRAWRRSLVGALILQHTQTLALRNNYFFNKGKEPDPQIDAVYTGTAQLINAIAATSLAGVPRSLSEYIEAAEALHIMPEHNRALFTTMLKYHPGMIAVQGPKIGKRLAVTPLTARKPPPALPKTLGEAFQGIMLCCQTVAPTFSQVKRHIADDITHQATLSEVTKAGLMRLLRQDSRTAPMRLPWHIIIG